jgi:hypothetical protein
MDDIFPHVILLSNLRSVKVGEIIKVVYENEIEQTPEGELRHTVEQTFFRTPNTPQGAMNFIKIVNEEYQGVHTDYLGWIIQNMDIINEIVKYKSLQDLNDGIGTRIYNRGNFTPSKILKTMRGQTPRSARFGNSIKTEIKYLKRLK